MLMFDHFQLAPVRGTALYKTQNPLQPFSPSQERGSQLYRTIHKVIYLEENMRFTKDPEWGEWLREARLGVWKPELRRFLQSSEVLNTSSRRASGLIQVVSTDNATRTTVNEVAIRTIASMPPKPQVFIIPSQVSSKYPIDFCELNKRPDNQTGNIPVFLHCYVGR